MAFILEHLPSGENTPVEIGQFETFDLAMAEITKDGRGTVTERQEWGSVKDHRPNARIFRYRTSDGFGGTSARTYLITEQTA